MHERVPEELQRFLELDMHADTSFVGADYRIISVTKRHMPGTPLPPRL
jgi:hypothetical protein